MHNRRLAKHFIPRVRTARSRESKPVWEENNHLCKDASSKERREDKRLPRDVKQIISTISTLGRDRLWQDALWIYSGLGRHDGQFDKLYHASMVAACERASNWRLAVELLSFGVTREIPVSLEAVRAAIFSCGKSRRWAAGLECLNIAYKLEVSLK